MHKKGRSGQDSHDGATALAVREAWNDPGQAGAEGRARSLRRQRFKREVDPRIEMTHMVETQKMVAANIWTRAAR